MPTPSYEHHDYLIKDTYSPFIFHTDGAPGMGYSNWHRNPEFLYCIEGTGEVICDNVKYSFSPGDTVVINSNVLHVIKSDTKVIYHCLIIDRSFFSQNGLKCEDYEFDTLIKSEKLEKLMNTICKLFESPSTPLNRAKIRASVLFYLTYLCEHHASLHDSPQSTKISKCSHAIRSCLEYIDKNFDQKLTLEHLAEHAKFSKYHFARIFKENTGFTITEQINARRCEEAKKLLMESGDKLSVSEIGRICGFDNPSYFTRTFRKYTGLLPSEFYRDSLNK